jgi:hypothetical protein
MLLLTKLLTNRVSEGALDLIWGNDDPNLDGVSGDGDQGRGRALGENRPLFYSSSNISNLI